MKRTEQIKIHRAKTEDGVIVLERNLIQEWRVKPESIKSIKLVAQNSLLDEVGLFLEADSIFFMTDAFEGFIDIATLLKFDQLFGNKWYQRAEAGEVLTWKSS